jgi:hypothetical protein
MPFLTRKTYSKWKNTIIGREKRVEPFSEGLKKKLLEVYGKKPFPFN